MGIMAATSGAAAVSAGDKGILPEREDGWGTNKSGDIEASNNDEPVVDDIEAAVDVAGLDDDRGADNVDVADVGGAKNVISVTHRR